MTAYCATADLLTGNIPTPAALSPDKYVQDAADEIDSKIGFVYETPVNIADDPANPVVRPVRLLLKRINVMLASGRLLMAAAASGEDKTLHAYAKSLVDNAELALEAIFDGTILLEGAVELNPPTDASHRGPLIASKDTSSAVDDFYDQLVPVGSHGGRVNGSLWVINDPRYNPEYWPAYSTIPFPPG